jgi:hypothetical protein
MNSTNENRRLLLKGIGAIGTSGALAACGGGSSSSTPASTGIQYFTEPSLPVGSTEITGIRGVNNSTDVFISGINMDNTTSPTTNYGLLYRGPVLIPNVNRWNKIGPAKPIITTNGSIINSSGLNFYGPDNGATAGSIVVVGNYNLANDPSYAYGLLYRGDIAGTGTYTQINPSSLVANGSAVDTIAHSNMNGYVVGNYINDIDDFGHAFIMAIGNTPDVPSTYTYVEIPRGSLTGGSISITAYGIWYNSNLNNYTIAGGFSKVLGENGLSTGYIIDWSPTAGFSNFTPIYYNNDSSTSKVSHVEGITTDNAGGYYLSVDWADSITQSRQGAAFVEIKRNSSGGFASPTWTSFAYPGAPATSANTVFERNVLGIYLPPTPYLAVFP